MGFYLNQLEHIVTPSILEKAKNDLGGGKVLSINFNPRGYGYQYVDAKVESSRLNGRVYLTSVVVGSNEYVFDYTCECAHYGICRHEAAALLKIRRMIASRSSQSVIQLINNYKEGGHTDTEEGSHPENSVHIVPVISKDKLGDNITVSFKMGADKLFVITDLIALASKFNTRGVKAYSKSFVFNHDESALDPQSRKYLRFIQKNVIFQPTNYKGNVDKKKIALTDAKLPEFLEILPGNTITIDKDTYEVINDDPRLTITFTADPDSGGRLNAALPDGMEFFNGYSSALILDNEDHIAYVAGKPYARSVGELLYEVGRGQINVSKDDLPAFYAVVLRKALPYCNIAGLEDYADIIPPECISKLYITTASNDEIYARLDFVYDNTVHSPFDKNPQSYRDLDKERTDDDLVTRYFGVCDGDLDPNHQYLCSGSENIYSLLSDGLSVLMRHMEVYTDDRFNSIRIRPPMRASVGVRPESGLLSLSLTAEGYTGEELAELLKAYRKGVKYHRLKDGSFAAVDNGVAELSELVSNLNITDKEILKKNIRTPMYRMLYLDSLKTDEVTIKRSAEFKEHIRRYRELMGDSGTMQVPDGLDDIMRDYQKYGFRWLKTISSYGFGGILADDMGLGKTLQAIALMVDAKNSSEKHIINLVVCPSSLVLNWQAEIERFAPELRTLMITGQAAARKELIASYADYDVLITSYSLIARDIAEYEECSFEYQFIDEAQYIKNHVTQASKAVKGIRSKVRFALTGTPVENSLAELWSIFDFIMPDYLFAYAHFKKSYETPIVKSGDKDIVRSLQKIVSPFILRRLKKDVLKELPEKTETVLTAVMEEEQSKLYSAQVAHIKEALARGLEPSERIQILAMLMKLRQICCDPRLTFDNYTHGSAKLQMCTDLVESCINSGHKVLLFSQFTSMLDLIRRELDNLQIPSCTLTGETKPAERLRLVNEFNENDVPVFLISLKAGGVGLNLTGADIVIHYDPWWNISAENQASDRAYRIGQKNNVTIYKLITKGTIEEKIRELQQKKADLADIATGGENNIMQMDADEIIDLLG